jgi:hypothetical protein
MLFLVLMGIDWLTIVASPGVSLVMRMFGVDLFSLCWK